MSGAVQLAYLVATALFVFSLHWMNDPKTARRGVGAGVAAMALAVLATWSLPEVVNHLWIVAAIAAGFAVGVPLSRVKLTAVPQRTALSHAFGGLAAGLVGTAKFYLWFGEGGASLTPFRTTALVAEVILGFVTLTGSNPEPGEISEPLTQEAEVYGALITACATTWRRTGFPASCSVCPAGSTRR